MTPGEQKQFVQDLETRADRLEAEAKILIEQAKALRATAKVFKLPGVDQRTWEEKPTVPPVRRDGRNQNKTIVELALIASKRKGGPFTIDDVLWEIPEDEKQNFNRASVSSVLSQESGKSDGRLVRIAHGIYNVRDVETRKEKDMSPAARKAEMRGRVKGLLRQGMTVLEARDIVWNEFAELTKEDVATIIADCAVELRIDVEGRASLLS